MSDPQIDEIIRQMKRQNSTLTTIGVLLLGILIAIAVLVMVLWKATKLQW